MIPNSFLFPQERSNKLLLIGLSLAFVLGFHLLFQPFQMRFYAWDTKLFVLGMYCMITLSVLLFSQFVMPRWQRNFVEQISRRMHGKLLWIILHIVVISVAVFAFKVLAGYYPFSWERVGTGLLSMLAIGSLPTGLFILWKWKHQQNIPVITAQEVETKVIFKANRGDKHLELSVDQLLFVEAQGNYVVIRCIDQEIRFRSTLSSVLNQLSEHSQFVSCHRAYVVNRDFFTGFSKHQGRPHLQVGSHNIPVSREKISLFRNSDLSE